MADTPSKFPVTVTHGESGDQRVASDQRSLVELRFSGYREAVDGSKAKAEKTEDKPAKTVKTGSSSGSSS